MAVVIESIEVTSEPRPDTQAQPGGPPAAAPGRAPEQGAPDEEDLLAALRARRERAARVRAH